MGMPPSNRQQISPQYKRNQAFMKAVLQRVSEASVRINGQLAAGISRGMVVLLGIHISDTEQDVDWLCKKIVRLRIFGDEQGLMNRSLTDIRGELLLVSQFTLQAVSRKGNRPSFIQAARPEHALPLYEKMIHQLEEVLDKKISTGIFGADMKVSLVNDGPVTLILDSRDLSS